MSQSTTSKTTVQTDARNALGGLNIQGSAQPALYIDGQSIDLPESAITHLREVLILLAKGSSVRVIEEREELSTQQAADLLNVSRTYLVDILEAGELPYRKVGAHRRVKLADVLEYKAEAYEHSQEILSELTREAQEQGFYD